jgi:predicted alpha/beta hydrolase family esterase
VLQPLPFRSMLVASRDDPHCSFERAREFAIAWNSEFIDAGPRGHINAESGLGDWPEGHRLLQQLAGSP